MPGHLFDPLASGRHISGILTVDPARDGVRNLKDLLPAALIAHRDESADRIATLGFSADFCAVIVDSILKRKQPGRA